MYIPIGLKGWDDVIIQLDLTHRINGGDYAWELQRLRGSESNPRWRSYKWFKSFGSAVQEAALAEIRLDPASSLSEALDAIDRVVHKYERLIDNAVERVADRADTKLRAVS